MNSLHTLQSIIISSSVISKRLISLQISESDLFSLELKSGFWRDFLKGPLKETFIVLLSSLSEDSEGREYLSKNLDLFEVLFSLLINKEEDKDIQILVIKFFSIFSFKVRIAELFLSKGLPKILLKILEDKEEWEYEVYISVIIIFKFFSRLKSAFLFFEDNSGNDLVHCILYKLPIFKKEDREHVDQLIFEVLHFENCRKEAIALGFIEILEVEVEHFTKNNSSSSLRSLLEHLREPCKINHTAKLNQNDPKTLFLSEEQLNNQIKMQNSTLNIDHMLEKYEIDDLKKKDIVEILASKLDPFIVLVESEDLDIRKDQFDTIGFNLTQKQTSESAKSLSDMEYSEITDVKEEDNEKESISSNLKQSVIRI